MPFEQHVQASSRGSGGANMLDSSTLDGSPHPTGRVTVMNAPVAALVPSNSTAQSVAGDRRYVYLDISQDNLPPGTASPSGRW